MTIKVLSAALVEGQGWILTREEAGHLEDMIGNAGVYQCTVRCGAATLGVGPGAYSIYGWKANSALRTDAPAEYLYSVERIRYAVNQYHCPDLKSLKEKLLQFPPGSTFDFAWNFNAGDEEEIVAISAFLLRHGYKVNNPQNWPFLPT